jgi:hypothetical protein
MPPSKTGWGHMYARNRPSSLARSSPYSASTRVPARNGTATSHALAVCADDRDVGAITATDVTGVGVGPAMGFACEAAVRELHRGG